MRPLVSASLPETRPQDNVALGPDTPQEEEYAVGALSPYSFYNGWCFPQNIQRYYDCVSLDKVEKSVVEEFKSVYDHFLRKVTIYTNNKRLVLKNPSNTARIKLLLEMYPESQFINIIRHPYDVYTSMLRFTAITIPLYSVGPIPSMKYAEQKMVELYAEMYEKYLKERTLIPKGNLVEIKYEDLVTKPITTLQSIYNHLGLKDFEEIKPRFIEYCKEQETYQKNHKIELSEKIKQRIQKEWSHVFDAFDYQA